ncbi:histidine kinase [Pseudonocardia xishanensis]|uniref:Signal transduction histidine kinase subgroup 3 dimerisation and phosphoacceptor domain-containing protein n=1 Tax=Pseudonocardia xishanensis TaxID=630995 RepID=A0ABP8RR29_9PSEU
MDNDGRVSPGSAPHRGVRVTDPTERYGEDVLGAVLDERARIADELNDRVIQPLFGLGLDLHGVAARVGDAEARRLATLACEVDGIIAAVRSAVFGLWRSREDEH